MKELKKILEACNEVVGVNLTDKCRKRDTYAYGRAAFYLISKTLYPRITLEKLGKMVGRDHATVLFSLRNSRETYNNDPIFMSIYNETLSKLGIKPERFDHKREEMITAMPLSVANYVRKLEAKVEQMQIDTDNIKKNYNNNILIEYCSQVPDEFVNEFIQYRVIPFLKMKLITN